MEIEFNTIDKRPIFEKARRMCPQGKIKIWGKPIIGAKDTLGHGYLFYAEVSVGTRILGNAIARNSVTAFAEAVKNMDVQD